MEAIKANCFLSFKTMLQKVRKTAFLDLQYADDCAILANTAEELMTNLDLLI